MNYRYALYRVRLERGVEKIIAINDGVYQQHLNRDGADGYENYRFLGIIETDLPPDELIETIEEVGDNRVEYYKDNILQIVKFINKIDLG